MPVADMPPMLRSFVGNDSEVPPTAVNAKTAQPPYAPT